MPALDNDRHEKFVQEVFSGKTATAAYQAVYGEKKSERVACAAAARLLAIVSIAARLKELQAEAAAKHQFNPAAEIEPQLGTGHRWFWLVVARFRLWLIITRLGLWLVVTPCLGLVVTLSRAVISRPGSFLLYATLPIVKPASSAAVCGFSSRCGRSQCCNYDRKNSHAAHYSFPSQLHHHKPFIRPHCGSHEGGGVRRGEAPAPTARMVNLL